MPSRSSGCSTSASRARRRCTATTASTRSSRPLDSVRQEVADDCVFVARLGDEVVGSVHGRVTDDGAASIGKLCVHPRLQGHGIGARLLRAAESALAEERGAKRFRLHTGHRSENNLRLYRRVGYETVGTAQGADGVPMIVLEKPAEAYATTA